MPCWIGQAEWIILNIAIQIQRLRIIQLCIRYGLFFGAPVRRHEPAQCTAVVARIEVVVS